MSVFNSDLFFSNLFIFAELIEITFKYCFLSGSLNPFEVELRPGQSQNVVNYASAYLGYFFFTEIGPGGWPSYKLVSSRHEK